MESQNIVYYRIFPGLSEIEDTESVENRLEELKGECLGVACAIADGYIWQHEPFNLRVCSSVDDFVSGKSSTGIESVDGAWVDLSVSELSSTDAFVPHLVGKVKFGDNLEDEWFVVYLLLEISRQSLDVSITVRDSDGEFLLIESSYYIPLWLRPENSHNRVFLRHGTVHIVPLLRTSNRRAPVANMSLKDSLQVFGNGILDTRASSDVRKVIMERLAGYPEKARKNLHRVRCKVPLTVAQILTYEPQLISVAVEAFYSRDMDAMKAASAMEKFSPKGHDGNVELLDMVVRMSRAMYAQLVQQVFQAPRNYPMPLVNSPGFKEAEIGMKIAVGFEMMCWERSFSESLDSLAHEVADKPSAEVGEVVVAEVKDTQVGVPIEGSNEPLPNEFRVTGKRKEVVLPNDVSWQKYKTNLDNSGYFRSLVEGSAEHHKLLQAAVTQYRRTDLFARVSTAMQAPVKRIAELLSMPHSASDFSKAALEQYDDDSWLYNGEDDLAHVMLERQKELDAYEAKEEKSRLDRKSSARSSNQKAEDGESFSTADVVNGVKSFLENVSSFEGVEIPNEDDIFDDDETVDLDMNRLLRELESVVDAKEISSMLSEGHMRGSTDSSSDTDLDYSASSASEDELEAGDDGAAQEEDAPGGRVAQEEDAPGSNGVVDLILTDEFENDLFIGEYSNVMDKELKSCSLVRSFTKKGVHDSTDNLKVSGFDPENADPEVVDKVECKHGDGDDLVDVDVNLVDSLLRSYMFQQGMPGPASNLLGSMGIELPDNADERPGPSKTPKK